MEIAVLGGGNGCYAAAADLSEAGHRVRFWRRNAAELHALQLNNTIVLKDVKGQRDVRIAAICSKIGDAVSGAELIVVPVPATAQLDIALAMAPFLHDGQVIFLPPGTFGSIAMMQVIRASGARARVVFAETGTLPYLTRKHSSREVAITMRAKRLPTGVFPNAAAQPTLAVLRQAYPCIESIEDALSGALMNAGPIIHPPLILMNAGPLEHFERWDIHKEGTQSAIRRVHDALDAERIAVRVALGYGPSHFPLNDHYTTDQWMYGDAHDRLTQSGDWREKIDLKTHRYMREDIVYGLALLVSIARWSGVAAPVASGLLSVAGAVIGEDIARLSPRTFEALGLSQLRRAQMADLLQRGL
jgi:opine dehydrogenase